MSKETILWTIPPAAARLVRDYVRRTNPQLWRQCIAITRRSRHNTRVERCAHEARS